MTQRQEPALPAPVQESAATVAGGHLYVLGGYRPSGASTSGVYLTDGNSWTTGPTLPESVNHPAAATLGSTVYLVGGFTNAGATPRAFALAPGAQRWAEVAPLHRARGALALLAVGGKLYAIGGNQGSTQVAIPEAYDPAADTWTDLPAMPQPRNHAAGWVDADAACVAGGRLPATSVAVDCFHTSTSTWQAEPSLPSGTTGAAGALLARDGGIELVAGGEPFPESSLVTIVQEYRAGAWTSLPMLVPRHGMGSAVFQGRLWMCAGATQPGIHPTTTCTSLG